VASVRDQHPEVPLRDRAAPTDDQGGDPAGLVKILLSAYACEPGRGSEPGIGWNMAKALAKEHEVWVMTSGTHRAATEAELAAHPRENLHVVYLDPFGAPLDWSSKRTRYFVYPHYYLWQVWAYFVGRSLHRKVGFDVAHHVTYVKYSTPSFVSLLPIPFFFGPVGGAESAPDEFLKDLDPSAKRFERLRSWARRVGEWDPFVRATVRRSAFAWGVTEDTAERLRRLGARNVGVAPEVGLDEDETTALHELPAPTAGPMRFIGMARLLHWKGFHLGLRAFARAGIPDAEFWILGDGPERGPLEMLAAELGIEHQVKFWGALDRQAALSKLGECHVLVHPSLHDSGGWVCVEAMAAGRPVVCLDLGGPAVQVNAECGFVIAADTPEQAIRDLAAAMTRLAADWDLCTRIGQAGQRHVKDDFSWDDRAETALREYRKVV
jgi:glycosyltransferase involved in cell wall biosynthesis